MWILTTGGVLVNLARCTRVAVVEGDHPGDLRIVASDGGKVEEELATGLTREQAEDTMFAIARAKLKAGRFKEDGSFFSG